MDAENVDGHVQKLWRKLAFVAAAVLSAFVFAVPQIIEKTSLRNAVLQQIIGDANLQVSSSGASFSWFSPLSIDDLELNSSNGNVSIAVGHLATEKPWLNLWLSTPDIGKIEVRRPHVEIVIDDDDDPEESDEDDVESLPTFSTVLTDGSLLVRDKNVKEPAINLTEIDITLHTRQRESGSVLIVEPIMLVQNQILTEEVCNQGLQLVAPVLSDEVSIEGKYSLELTTMQLALGREVSKTKTEASQIEGVVTLHHVTAGLKNEVTRRMIMVAAELLELDSVPDRIRMTKNAEIRFRLSDGRIGHEGMALVLPDVAPGFSIRSAGSVSLDETLDLSLVIRIPLTALSETPLARELSESPLELRVTGTIDQPIVAIPEQQEWALLPKQRLSSSDSSASEKALAEKIITTLDELQENPKS